MESTNTVIRLHRETKNRSSFSSILLGLTFTALFSMAFLAIAALCAYTMPDPHKLLLPLSLSSLVLSSLICGFLSAKFAGRRGLITGLLSGLLFAGVLYTASLIFGIQSESGLWVTVGIYAGVTLLSGLGGILGVSRPKRRPQIRFPS